MPLENQKSRDALFQLLLNRVEKPGRYLGGEVNSIVKPPEKVRLRLALAFPDIYDLGMSYHGFRILYERINGREGWAAERVFTPWMDAADLMRQAGLPLWTLESRTPLQEVDVIGFTLQHELSYTNVLEMVDLAQLPLRAVERDERHPLILAGGEGAYSPEPLADFVDCFLLGDGEGSLEAILAKVEETKGQPRHSTLKALAQLPGVYVPSFYAPRYHKDGAIAAIDKIESDAPDRVYPVRYSLAADVGPVHPIVPSIRSTQDRSVVEIRRGCVHGCRFCHGGMTNRPIRERPAEQALEAATASLQNSGDSEVSVLSLSSADYSALKPLLQKMAQRFSSRHISLSIPSLRISSFDVELAAELSAVRKSGFTFAPEAGSERLRRIINKPLDEEAFLDATEAVLRKGWKTLKWYFMLGLPGETREDLDGILRLVEGAREQARKVGVKGLKLNLTLSPFVPKAHTPFQWEGQAEPEAIREKQRYVRERLPKGVDVKTSPLESSLLEAVFARGDRRLGAALQRAWEKGCRFDAWREGFRLPRWQEAFAECGLSLAFYAHRERADDEIFPYEHLEAGVGRPFLERERSKAREAMTTPECQGEDCAGCAACASSKAHETAPLEPDFPPPPEEKVYPPNAPPVQRLRFCLTKTGPLQFIAHLDFAEAVHRLFQRSGLPLAYSQGFNPQPKLALSPPLPLGVEGAGERVDAVLVERVSTREALNCLLSQSAPAGLTWKGVEEIPLKAPSLQQAITAYHYRLFWRPFTPEERRAFPDLPETGDMPDSLEELEAFLDRFFAAESWEFSMERKGKVYKRDARKFVKMARPLSSASPFTCGLELEVASENGATLSPLKLLEAWFGPGAGDSVFLSAVRLDLEIET